MSQSGSQSVSMSSGNNISSSNSQYAQLLATVTDLQHDLEKALQQLSVQASNNNILKETNDRLTEELSETQARYHEVRSNYVQAVQQAQDKDKHNQDFLARIKLQLNEKTKEFESQRERFKPQDIDSIKIKIQEELEFSHSMQLNSVKTELEQYKELYQSLKNENEMNQVAYQMKCDSYEKQGRQLTEKYNDLNRYIHEKMAAWADQNYQLEKEEIIRNQSIKIYELESILKNVKEECHGYHDKYESLAKDAETTTTKYNEMMFELKGRMTLNDSERHNTEEKMKYMRMDLDKKDMAIKMLRIQYDEQREKFDILQHSYDDATTQFILEKDDLNKEIESLRTNYENRLLKGNEQIQLLSERLAEREDSIKRLQRQSSDLQTRYETNEREIRRLHQQQVQELQKRYVVIEGDLAAARKELSSIQQQNNLQDEKKSTDIELYKSEVSRIKREKEVLHERLREMERKLQRISSLESQIGENKIRESSQQKELAQCRNTIRDMERNYESLSLKYDSLQREHQIFVETVQQETKRRIETIHQNVKSKFIDMKTKLKDKSEECMTAKKELNKEKKRSELYKEKALQAHRQQKLLASIVGEHEQLLSSEI